MPELPEVEGARKLVQQHCQGKRIVRAVVAEDEKVINDVSPGQLQGALVGRVLAGARRKGKQMWWELDSGPALLVHLGMTGGIVVKGVGAAHYKSFHIDDSSWPPKWTKIELEFEDGTQLAFCDSRRFAKVRFLPDPETRPPISELGWDPMLTWPGVEDFVAKLGGGRRAIKALLLDQSFSAGVGNWVADEVLYQSRIHPEQPSNSILPDQAATLHRTIREVCELACSVNADSSRFPSTWLFHYRWGKGSSTKSKIGGHTIDHITVGGRTSAVVPALQKLSKAAIAAAAVKAEAGGKKAASKSAAGGKKAGAAAAGADGSESGGDEAVAAAAAEAGAVAAVAVAQGEAKPRVGRSKAAAAQQAAAAAAEAAEAVLAQAEADDAVPVPAARSKAGRGRQAKQQPQKEQRVEEEDQGGQQEGEEVAAAGPGTRIFRSKQAAQKAKGKPAGATAAAGGAAKAQAAPAAARKRKAPAPAAKDSAAAAESGAVSGRRRKAAR